jgi:hypothetical protein
MSRYRIQVQLGHNTTEADAPVWYVRDSETKLPVIEAGLALTKAEAQKEAQRCNETYAKMKK